MPCLTHLLFSRRPLGVLASVPCWPTSHLSRPSPADILPRATLVPPLAGLCVLPADLAAPCLSYADFLRPLPTWSSVLLLSTARTAFSTATAVGRLRLGFVGSSEGAKGTRVMEAAGGAAASGDGGGGSTRIFAGSGGSGDNEARAPLAAGVLGPLVVRASVRPSLPPSGLSTLDCRVSCVPAARL